MAIAAVPVAEGKVVGAVELSDQYFGPEMVIDPAALVTYILVPLTANVVATGELPVDPINICPFVGAEVVVNNPAVPEYKKLLAVNAVSVIPPVVTVKPDAAVIVPGALKTEGILRVIEPEDADAVI